jgi:very-short-patch-repair endonuclease
MDFLMLFPGNQRVVIEVDGQHHYADDDGHAQPRRYAQMVSEDRKLRLAGYEVYRFGGYELSGEQAAAAASVRAFFRDLFIRHAIPILR